MESKKKKGINELYLQNRNSITDVLNKLMIPGAGEDRLGKQGWRGRDKFGDWA